MSLNRNVLIILKFCNYFGPFPSKWKSTENLHFCLNCGNTNWTSTSLSISSACDAAQKKWSNNSFVLCLSAMVLDRIAEIQFHKLSITNTLFGSLKNLVYLTFVYYIVTDTEFQLIILFVTVLAKPPMSEYMYKYIKTCKVLPVQQRFVLSAYVSMLNTHLSEQPLY